MINQKGQLGPVPRIVLTLVLIILSVLIIKFTGLSGPDGEVLGNGRLDNPSDFINIVLVLGSALLGLFGIPKLIELIKK